MQFVRRCSLPLTSMIQLQFGHAIGYDQSSSRHSSHFLSPTESGHESFCFFSHFLSYFPQPLLSLRNGRTKSLETSRVRVSTKLRSTRMLRLPIGTVRPVGAIYETIHGLLACGIAHKRSEQYRRCGTALDAPKGCEQYGTCSGHGRRLTTTVADSARCNTRR